MSSHQSQKKIHVDIDPSSIEKNIKVDLSIVSDVLNFLKSLNKRFKEKNKDFLSSNKSNTSKWWKDIDKWRQKNH